jgi:hypothetical protein
MSSTKQKAAARHNVKKAVTAAKRKKTISHLSKPRARHWVSRKRKSLNGAKPARKRSFSEFTPKVRSPAAPMLRAKRQSMYLGSSRWLG